jgi:hypothetical protein
MGGYRRKATRKATRKAFGARKAKKGSRRR